MDPNIINNGGYAQSATKTAPSQPNPPADNAAGGSFPMPHSTSYDLGPNPAAFTAAQVPPVPQNPSLGTQSPLQNVPNDVEKTIGTNVPQESPTIEVEWVGRVSNIVNSTTNDPYAKSYQMALLKSEYLKKVYGKEIEQRGQK